MQVANRESFAVASRRRLPYDAAVEYLQSTGTQYFDLGLYNTPVRRWEIDFASTKRPGETFQSLIGVQGGGGIGRVSCIIIGTNTSARFTLANISAYSIRDEDIAFASVAAANDRHVYAVDSQSFSASLDSATIRGSAVANLVSFLPVYILARNTDGTVTNFASGRLYGMKVSDAGTPVADCIPVRVGSVGYMYDRVSGRLFGNAGTGSFIVGPDIN